MLKEINHENISLPSECIKVHSCRTGVCHIEYLKTKNGHSCRSRISLVGQLLFQNTYPQSGIQKMNQLIVENETEKQNCISLWIASPKIKQMEDPFWIIVPWKLVFHNPGETVNSPLRIQDNLQKFSEKPIIYLFCFEISGQKFILLVQLQSLLQYNES